MKLKPEIPTWMRELPDNATVGNEEICKIWGMHKGSLKRCIESGVLPAPTFRVKRSGGIMSYRWRLGVIRKAVKDACSNAALRGGEAVPLESTVMQED